MTATEEVNQKRSKNWIGLLNAQDHQLIAMVGISEEAAYYHIVTLKLLPVGA